MAAFAVAVGLVTPLAGLEPASAAPTTGAGVLSRPVEVSNPVGVVPGLSTRTSSTRRNADGTYTMDVALGPVNYRDASGAWTPIDNTLVAATAADGASGFRNTGNDYTAFLPTDAMAAPVRFALGDAWVSMKMAGLPAAAPTVAGDTATYALGAGGVGGAGGAGGVGAGGAVSYAATDTGLKETITLSQAPVAPPVYVYDLQVSKGLTARVDEAGNVRFAGADGSKPFFIPVGHMSDSAAPEAAYSAGVAYSLAPAADGYRLVVRPDWAWLRAPERVYPVAIDPSVDSSTNPPKDCWLGENTATTNHCNTAQSWVGVVQNYKRRSLFDFRYTLDSPYYKINTATVSLYLDAGQTVGTGGSANWAFYQPGTDWSSAATWNNSGTGTGWSGGSPGSDTRSDQVAINGDTSGWKSWDVKAGFVDPWRQGTLPQRGMLLRQVGETINKGLVFLGQATGGAARPTLRINYTNQSPTTMEPSSVSPWVAATSTTTTTPTITTQVFDSENNASRTDTYVYDQNGNYVWGAQTGFVAAGSRTSVQVPDGFLAPGSVYQTVSYPYDGTSFGSPSPPRWFAVGTCQDFGNCPAGPVIDQQSITQKTVTLQASQANGSWAVYRYRRGASGTFAAIPVGDESSKKLATSDGALAPTGPYAANGGAFTPYVWDLSKTLGSSVTRDAVQVVACYAGSSAGPFANCSAPWTINYAPTDFGLSRATAAVGPGTVSLATGNYQVSDSDAAISTPVGSISLSRTATTMTDTGPTTAAAGVFGAPWRASFSGSAAGWTELVPTVAADSGSVTFTSPDGTQMLLAATGYPVTYTPVGDALGTGLSARITDTGDLALADPDGSVTTWTKTNGVWRVLKVEENGQSGQSSTYTYDEQGTIARITGPAPAGVTCTDPDTTPGCRSLRFTYGDVILTGGSTATARRLLKVTASLPTTAGATNLTDITQYEYDSSGRLAGVYDPRISPTLKTTYGYDTAANTTSPRLATLTPPGLPTWSLSYDAQERLTRVSRTVPVGTAQTATTAATTVVYDLPLAGDGLPTLTSAAAATWGQKTFAVNGSGVAVFPPSHPPAQPLAKDMPAGEWSYAGIHHLDANGREVDTAAWGDNQWLIDTTQYDRAGNPTWSLSAKNRQAALYTPGSGVAAVDSQNDSAVRANLLATISTYSDDLTELLTTSGPTHDITLADGSTVTGRDRQSTTYDQGAPDGNVNPRTKQPYRLPTTMRTDVVYNQGSSTTAYPDATVTRYGYDPVGSMSGAGTSGWKLGRPTTTTVQMAADPSAADLTTTTVYDPQGRVLENRLPGDTDGTTPRTTKIGYYTASGTGECVSPVDAGLSCISKPGGQPTTGNQLPVTTTTYDAFASPLTIRQVVGSGTVAPTRTTTNTFDGAQRLASSSITTGGAVSSKPLPTVSFSYDATTGNLLTQAWASGTKLATNYDAAGRVRTYTDTQANTATTSYDIDDRPMQVTDNAATTTWAYETDAEQRGLPTSTSTTVGAVTATFSGTYDAAGSLQTQTYPGGLTATLTADPAGNPTTLTYVKNATIWLGFTRRIAPDGKVAADTATLSGQTSSSQAYTYDRAGRLTTVADQLPGNGTCTTRKYGFDTHSNRTQLNTWTISGSTCATTSTPTPTTWGYDAADRLTTTPGGAPNYDGLGRETQISSGDANNQGTLNLSYYANDLLYTQTQGSQKTQVTLDPAANRVVARVFSNGSASNGTRQRTDYYDNPSDSPAWTKTSSTRWSVNVVGLDGDLAATIAHDSNATAPDTLTVSLANLHGDLVATTTPTATTAPTDYHESTEYGLARTPAATSDYSWLGTHQRSTDLLGGLTLMGVRLYNPTSGRFSSTDPVYGGNANSYTYPLDPIDYTDITGLACIGCSTGSGCGDCLPLALGTSLLLATSGAVNPPMVSAPSWPTLPTVPSPAEIGHRIAQEVEHLRDQILNAKRKKTGARNAERKGHTSGSSGRTNDKHTGAQGFGGREKPNFKSYQKGKGRPQDRP